MQPSPRDPASDSIRPLWAQSLTGGARGVALAREKGWILAWDDADWLSLLNSHGERQAQVHAPDRVVAACCSDDGSAWTAVGAGGQVWWLAPDLATRWERSLPAPAVSAALDAFGQYLAVTDQRGRLHVLDRLGRAVCHVDCPRPLKHLCFTPTGLVGSADYGLVAAFDLAGGWRWRDGPVAHVGGLSVSGDGNQVVLACFSEGLLRYDGLGKKLERVPAPEPCRLVSMSYAGQRLLLGGLTGRVTLLDSAGATVGSHALEQPIAALAVGALGESAVVALADGPIVRLALKQS